MQLALFNNGMVSTTEWQADASLWKDDTFFDAGTFCLPSIFPQASLEAYTVNYDLETGIHDVFLTLKGIIGLSTLSTSSQSSHLAEFYNGVMKAVHRLENVAPHSSSTCEETSSDKQATSSPACYELDVPIHVPEEAGSSSSMISNTESTEEQIAQSDNLGAVYSPRIYPEQTKPLIVLTDLVLYNDNSPSASSSSESSSDNGANTQSKPATAATSPTFSLPQDLRELHAREEEVSTTISGLDLEEKPSKSKPWQCIPFQWLDMAVSDRQYYWWDEIQEKEKPESVQVDQTVDMFPHLASPGEVERPLQLEDLDLDMIFGQAATELDGEGLPQEAIILDDETVTGNNDIDPVGTPNDYQSDGPEFHHLNLLRNRVYQASRTSSALSLWVTMTSKRKVQIKDSVSLKAVVSAQAAKWVDPVLLQEGVSVPEEVREPGNATAYRNFLTGSTIVQYEPCGTWESETHDCEQERPHVMDSETEEILRNAYIESDGFPGIQRPCFVEEGDDHWSYSYPDRQMKQRKGWESPERLGDSKLRFVLDEDSITERHAPVATPTSYEVAEPTDVYEDENGYVEDNFVFPANESELVDLPGACEADERYQAASSLRSLLASSPLTNGAMSPLHEGRYFTPRIREDSGESDDLSDSSDGEFWETDENGAFVSPKKGKKRLKGGMDEDSSSGTLRTDEDSLGLPKISFGQLMSGEAQGNLPPTGICRLPEPELEIMALTMDGATGGDNALHMLVEGSSTQEDVLEAGLSIPYCKYNDVSEIPLRSTLAATVGQAGREAARWLAEKTLW